MELEVLRARKEPDEIQDLSVRAVGFFEGKEYECWREVSRAPLETGYLEIRKYREVVRGTPAKLVESEFEIMTIVMIIL